MKIFMTGATGFIGTNTARLLRQQGHELTCLVRDPGRAVSLVDLGCELIEGDLSSRRKLAEAMEGADAVVHNAALYEVGIPDSRRSALFEANVQGTANTLGACLDAATERVLYVSSCVVFGNTHGEVATEDFQRKSLQFDSVYEQTKFEAHQIALNLIETEGLPCVIAQPAGVFGPDDHSALGGMINQFVDGKLPLIPFPDLGSGETHVEDIAAGLLLVLEKGRLGESYILNSENLTVRQMLETTAKITGGKPPGRAMPTAVLKLLRPVGPLVGKLMDQPPNLSELIRSADGVTFYASAAKARQELGFAPRSVEAGLRDMLAAEGRI
jgi:nucleoside-diphosphate-sugar epimerase